MRLAVCALSTVLLSGCSWFGGGGGQNGMYGYDNYGYGAGYSSYGQTTYGQHANTTGCAPMMRGYVQTVRVNNSGCAPGGSYGVASGAYGQAGAYGQGGASGYGGAYGQSGAGAYGQSGAMGYGQGSSSQSITYGGATTIGASAPYGAAAAGAMQGGGNVQTVMGAPIYVPQPYPAYYNAQAPALRGQMSAGGAYGGGYGQGGGFGYGGAGGLGGYGAGCCGGGALPVGIEVGVGTEFDIKGNIFPGEVTKPFLGGPGTVSDLEAVSYADAFKSSSNIDLAATFDLNQNTTLIGQVGYSQATGQRNKVGTVDNGAGTTEDLFAEFSDLKQLRFEGGVRRYMSKGRSPVRPYVGASAGFVNVKDVELTQSSTTLVDPTLFTQNYVDGGWHPTASGVIGAEWQVGGRSAIGVETGIRWSDDLDTNFQSGDRWAIPLKLRGRVSF